MRNLYNETVTKLRQQAEPILLNTLEDIEARKRVSEDMKRALAEYIKKAIK